MTVVAERLYTIPITCCLDGRTHDVTDESVAAGRVTGGRYEALCSYVVVPAAMVAPVGRPCAARQHCPSRPQNRRAVLGKPATR